MREAARAAALAATLGLVTATLASCGSGKRDHGGAAPPPSGASDGRRAPPPAAPDAAPATPPPAAVTLPTAAPVPAPPLGLPPLPAGPAPTAEAVALGHLLFFERRLAADGTTSCATCHVPANGLSGDEPHALTAAGKPNLRRTPALVNLAWQRELGWDGRGATPAEFLATHAAGQLGQALAVGLTRVLGSPTYRAHLTRAAGAAGADAGADDVAVATAALWAFVATRYSAASGWDRYEAGDVQAVPPIVVDGYRLFIGKAQCATCHTPPLYTDLGYHRLGLVAVADDGRGLVDRASTGAFKTPTLRGAYGRRPLFHDGSAATLDDAIAWHLAGGRGQDAAPSVIDPALVAVTLTPAERAALTAFVRALTPAAVVTDVATPVLPADVPEAP